MLTFDIQYEKIECHPSIPSQMISASTDGLINNYDVMDFDEQEALISVMNSGSSVTKAGYFGPEAEYVYCLTHIETFSLFTLEVRISILKINYFFYIVFIHCFIRAMSFATMELCAT